MENQSDPNPETIRDFFDCIHKDYMDGSVGSSYMCVANTTGNAPSSGGTPHASWEYLAKGQATSPTTTQGDLIVRGASADERLAIGSAGQATKSKFECKWI